MWWLLNLLNEAQADPGVPIYLYVLLVIFLLMAIGGWGGLAIITIQNRRRKKA